MISEYLKLKLSTAMRRTELQGGGTVSSILDIVIHSGAGRFPLPSLTLNMMIFNICRKLPIIFYQTTSVARGFLSPVRTREPSASHNGEAIKEKKEKLFYFDGFPINKRYLLRLRHLIVLFYNSGHKHKTMQIRKQL